MIDKLIKRLARWLEYESLAQEHIINGVFKLSTHDEDLQLPRFNPGGSCSGLSQFWVDYRQKGLAPEYTRMCHILTKYSLATTTDIRTIIREQLQQEGNPNPFEQQVDNVYHDLVDFVKKVVVAQNANDYDNMSQAMYQRTIGLVSEANLQQVVREPRELAQQLQQLAATQPRVIRLADDSHTVSLICENDRFYYLDTNHSQGVIESRDPQVIAKAIFKSLEAYNLRGDYALEINTYALPGNPSTTVFAQAYDAIKADEALSSDGYIKRCLDQNEKGELAQLALLDNIASYLRHPDPKLERLAASPAGQDFLQRADEFSAAFPLRLQVVNNDYARLSAAKATELLAFAIINNDFPSAQTLMRQCEFSDDDKQRLFKVAVLGQKIRHAHLLNKQGFAATVAASDLRALLGDALKQNNYPLFCFLADKVLTSDTLPDPITLSKYAVVAAKQGNLPLLKKLKDLGADLRWCQADELEPLTFYAALTYGQSAVLTYLLDQDDFPSACFSLYQATDSAGQTVLQRAVRAGHPQCTAVLLARGCDPLKKNSANGMNALHVASQFGDLQSLEELINTATQLYDLDAVLSATDNAGGTLFHYMARYQQWHLLNFICEKYGASDNGVLETTLQQADHYGNTPLHLLAAAAEDVRAWVALQAIMPYEPSLTLQNRQGQTPLVLAAESNNPRVFNQLLSNELARVTPAEERAVADIAVLQRDHPDLLLAVAKSANAEFIQPFLPAFAAAQDVQLLHAAARSGNDIALVNMLGLAVRDPAVQINQADDAGNHFLHHLINHASETQFAAVLTGFAEPATQLSLAATDAEQRSLYQTALAAGKLAIARQLQTYGVPANTCDAYDNTPLHTAAVYAQATDIITYICDAGVNIQQRNAQGETALHVAATHKNKAVCQQLLAQGAKVNEQDNAGQTPLHKAVASGNYALVEYLLDNGAKVGIRDNAGRTALDLAVANKHAGIAQRLHDQSLNAGGYYAVGAACAVAGILCAVGSVTLWPLAIVSGGLLVVGALATAVGLVKTVKLGIDTWRQSAETAAAEPAGQARASKTQNRANSRWLPSYQQVAQCTHATGILATDEAVVAESPVTTASLLSVAAKYVPEEITEDDFGPDASAGMRHVPGGKK